MRTDAMRIGTFEVLTMRKTCSSCVPRGTAPRSYVSPSGNCLVTSDCVGVGCDRNAMPTHGATRIANAARVFRIGFMQGPPYQHLVPRLRLGTHYREAQPRCSAL